MAIASFILGNGTAAGLQITGIVSPIVGWSLVGFSTAVSGALFAWAFKLRTHARSLTNDGTELLRLLDDVYVRLKSITRRTIRKMRSTDWEDVTTAYPFLMDLSEIDVDTAIHGIILKNLYYLQTGQKLTLEKDGKKLAKQMLESPLFTRNPESIAKDASIILKEKVPYLKKKLDHDHTYKRLLRLIEHERDVFPSDDVSNSINEYLDHSIKINVAWVLSTYDLDHWSLIEGIAGRHNTMKLKIILWGLPGRMDEEMGRNRTKVARSILQFHKEQAT